MLSGKIKLETESSIRMKFLWVIAITLFFVVNMNYVFKTSSIIWYGTLLLLVAAYVLSFNGRIMFSNLSFFKWAISFLIFGCVSMLWCLSESFAFDVIKSQIINIVALFLILFSLNYGFKFSTLLKCYFVATLFNAVYILLTIDVSQLGEVQVGTNLIEGWNGNGIGFMATQGAIIGVYLFRETTFKFEKLIITLGIIFLAFLSAYTGSRTAFIVLILGFIVYYWMCNPKKAVKNVILTALVVFCALYVIMNVEGFYNVLGKRFEGLFSLFTGKGEADTSSMLRDKFIENGKKWFLDKPLFGYGLNNYKVLNLRATGEMTYAHNNFIEIAVDLGIVGLIWYYAPFLVLAVKLLLSYKKGNINIYLFVSLIISVVSHYGTVSYYGFYQNFILLLCFYVVDKMKEKQIDD